MTRPSSLAGRAAVCALTVLLPQLALARSEVPLDGDLVHGGRAYRVSCAACHGLGAQGDGPLAHGLDPKPTRLRDGGVLWSRSEAELLAVIVGERDTAMSLHGKGISALDARDVLAWIKEPVPTLGSFFPDASDYIAHTQTLDKYGLERAEKALGAALPEADRSIMIFTMFKPELDENSRPVVHEGEPAKVPEDNILLQEAKPRRKVGFVAFAPLSLDAGELQVVIALDRMMRVRAVSTVPETDARLEALRKRLTPVIESYAGSGGREEKRPFQPQKRGVTAPKDLHKALYKAYIRTLEGAAMYEKEERDRFWSDPEAFKFPEAADMEEVKFKFQEQRRK